jgi:hypothetical protein
MRMIEILYTTMQLLELSWAGNKLEIDRISRLLTKLITIFIRPICISCSNLAICLTIMINHQSNL